MHNGTTITQFIIEEQRHVAGATGDFTSLLNDIVTACKVISNMVNHGALVGVLGSAGSENIQGETQKKLDILTNEVFIKSNEWAGTSPRWPPRRWTPSTIFRRGIRAANTC
jgi:fructose-1,6-bisphosphatase I